MSTRVVNVKDEEYDVYCGRGSIWGNPFTVETVGRLRAIELYHTHYLPGLLNIGVVTEQDLLALQGKRLGCHCKPQPCHCDKLAELVEEVYANKNRTANK